MRAMAVTGFGEPLTEVEVEEPDLIPGHVLLQLLTCGVCFTDVKTSRGKMPFSPTLSLPHIPGHELCGRVIATDPAGALPEGAVVVVYHLTPCRLCQQCRAGHENLCQAPKRMTGLTTPGGFQERFVAPLDRVTVVPDGIDPVRAAPITCAVGTAYRAVASQGRISGGSKVVIIGLGGVGIHALQVARAMGARAIGVDLSEDALMCARGLGLTALDGSGPAVEEAVLDHFPGGADVVVDVVGIEPTLARAGRLVRAGGRIVVVGYSTTTDLVLPTARLVLNEIEVIGSRYARRDDLDRALRMVADGLVEPIIDRVLPLESVNEAFAALESGTVTGRIVLDIAGVSGG